MTGITYALPCVLAPDQITLDFHTDDIVEQAESRPIDKCLYISENLLGRFKYILKRFLALSMQVMSWTCAELVTYVI